MKEIRIDLNPNELYKFMKSSPGSYLYCIGDLDPLYWPETKWYAYMVDEEVKAIAMLYLNAGFPVLIALQHHNAEYLEELLLQIADFLPDQVYGHIAVDVLPKLECFEMKEYHGKHYRMVLSELSHGSEDPHIIPLNMTHHDELLKLYQTAYPGNWYEQSMLEKGVYLGWREHGNLVGVAGTHIYSPSYGISALGNITTHPDYRGQGIAEKLTTQLCILLLQKTPVIGLSVLSENSSAIKCYEKIGFRIMNDYEEGLIKVYKKR